MKSSISFSSAFSTKPLPSLAASVRLELQVFNQKNESTIYRSPSTDIVLGQEAYRMRGGIFGAGFQPLIRREGRVSDRFVYVLAQSESGELRALRDRVKLSPFTRREVIPGSKAPFGWGLSEGDSIAKKRIILLMTSDKIDLRALAKWSKGDQEIPLFAPEIAWASQEMHITLRRDNLQISQDAELTVSEGGIRIKPHPSLQATVSVSKIGAGNRDLEGGSAFPMPDFPGMRLIDLSGSRSSDQQQVIELKEIQIADPESLKKQPLEIVLPQPLHADEVLLPVSFDGEFFHVVGDTETLGGETLVNIREIPAVQQGEEHAQDRNLFRALKLAFLKTVLHKEQVNCLRWVDYQTDGSFERKEEGIKARVDQASNILVVVHGIIGDTKHILEGLSTAKDELGRPIKEQADLILAFDYENLNTPIEETALDLKRKLQQIGLGEFDNKEVTLMGVSMGGLVIRSLVELSAGGNKMVDQIILVGTPNAGSNFGNLVSGNGFGALSLSIALNLIPTLLQSATSFFGKVKREGGILQTLRQMAPDSDFLQKLNAAPHPNIPYTIIGGDITDVKATGKGFKKFKEKLLLKIGEWMNPDIPHDVAVPLANIFNEHIWEKRQCQVELLHTNCHHLAYFQAKLALETLGKLKLANLRKDYSHHSS